MKSALLFALTCIALVLTAFNAVAQLSSLNDEFSNAATLSNWQNINTAEGWNAEQLELLDINATQPGKMVQMPYTCSWYADYHGPIIYKTVTGDFIFTTNVSISNRNGNGVPATSYSLGGVMIRTPRNFPNGALGAGGWNYGGENYIFLSIGYGNENGPGLPGAPPHLEVKTTENSNSVLHLTPIDQTAATIRSARIGDVFIVLYHLAGDQWIVHQRYERTDMPAALQIGLVTYTDWDKVATYEPLFQNSHVLNAALNPDPSTNPFIPFHPDLVAGFDFARFSEVLLPPELNGVDLYTSATDQQLLTFLGYDASPVCGAPASVTAYGIVKKSAIIQSTDVGATEYQVRYRVTGTTAWTKKKTSINTIKIKNLLPCTNYTYNMRANCNGTWLSSPNATFTTTGCRLMEEEQQANLSAITIYPNPATNQIMVQWHGEADQLAEIKIFNSLGQVIRHIEFPQCSGVNSLQVAIDSFQDGIYLVQVEGLGEGRLFVKQ
ncbi:MAG TPA: T9SS type A sorting domain-containing protein [Chitinophagales bacterium]|nr:T9SS type A sorting domain-containing protein [Chitinophagales bacterium]